MNIRQCARSLAKRYRTTSPFDVAERLGIIISYEQLPPHVRGFYVRVLRRRFIVINQSLRSEWKRFVCAHELGHDRLHRGYGYYFIEEQTLFCPGRFEREANRFAVEFLAYPDQVGPGESIRDFYLRNHIPMEIIDKT